jgi:hypothetical protein
MSVRSDITSNTIALGCDDAPQIHYLLSAAGECDNELFMLKISARSRQFFPHRRALHDALPAMLCRRSARSWEIRRKIQGQVLNLDISTFSFALGNCVCR